MRSIVERLKADVLKLPTEAEWIAIAEKIFDFYRFPHVLGAIDGKHIRIKAPPHSGSLYYNYKGYFSTVLLAIVDADLKFVMVDVGSQGRQSDAGIFKKSNFYERMENGELNIPESHDFSGKFDTHP